MCAKCRGHCITGMTEPLEPIFDKNHTLSEAQRWAIISLRADGYRPSAIAAKIPCSTSTVYHWIHFYDNHGTVTMKKQSGRKRKSSEETDNKIIEAAISDPTTRPKKIKAELDLHVSPRTIRRRLNECGLFGRIARSEFPFSAVNIRKRLSFAQGYLDWKKEDWSNVIWSDETHIELQNYGQQWVQRPIGAAFEHPYLRTQVPHAQRLSLWACFSGNRVGKLYIFDDILDAKKMKQILRDYLLPSATELFVNRPWWFQQDNDPKHKSKLVTDWIFANGVQCIDFPPYSPDLNPIENLWHNLKTRVSNRNCATLGEFKQVIAEEWAQTDRSFLDNLTESMHRRCLKVLANAGHKCGY
jgi:transposase